MPQAGDAAGQVEVDRRAGEAFLQLLDVRTTERAEALAAMDLPEAVQVRVRALLDAQRSGDGVDDDAPRALPPAEPVPERIDHYVVGELIGRGGTADVYAAVDSELPDREVALKVVRKRDPDTASRVLREARILGRFDHPGIVDIHRVLPLPDGRLALVMKRVGGRSLLETAAGAELSRQLEVLARVCDVMQYAHDRFVYHRDIKPDNIRVTDDGQPVVFDFGAALDDDVEDATLTAPGTVIGTVPYMSPERLRGKRAAIDVRSEVWALGIVAYEVLGSGAWPFGHRKDTRFEIAEKIFAGGPTPLGTIAPACRGDVEAVIMKAFAADRDARYASVRELAADLRAAASHRPVSARAPSVSYRLRKWMRRHPWRVVATLLMLGLLGVSGRLFGDTLYRWEQEAAAATEQDLARAAMAHVSEDAATAESLYRRVLERDPTRPEAVFGLALIQLRFDREAALATVAPLATAHPLPVAAIEELARTADGSFPEALFGIDATAIETPLDAYLLGVTYLRSAAKQNDHQRLEVASDLLLAAALGEMTGPLALHALVEAVERTNDRDRAKHVLLALGTYEPIPGVELDEVALAHVLGHHADVIRRCNDLLRDHPDMSAARGRRALARGALGDHHGALGDYLWLATHGQSNSHTLFNLGRSAIEQPQSRALALWSLELARRLDPAHAPTHYVIGRMAQDELDHAHCAVAYEMAARLGLQTPRVWLGAALARLQLRDRTGALCLLEEGLDAWPRNPDLEAARLLVLQSLGRWTEAGRAATALLAQAPPPEEAAVCHAVIEQSEEAGLLANVMERDAQPRSWDEGHDAARLLYIAGRVNGSYTLARWTADHRRRLPFSTASLEYSARAAATVALDPTGAAPAGHLVSRGDPPDPARDRAAAHAQEWLRLEVRDMTGFLARALPLDFRRDRLSRLSMVSEFRAFRDPTVRAAFPDSADAWATLWTDLDAAIAELSKP